MTMKSGKNFVKDWINYGVYSLLTAIEHFGLEKNGFLV